MSDTSIECPHLDDKAVHVLGTSGSKAEREMWKRLTVRRDPRSTLDGDLEQFRRQFASHSVDHTGKSVQQTLSLYGVFVIRYLKRRNCYVMQVPTERIGQKTRSSQL